tara:strand:+ start:626 stop:808 length:183 start_codon:yes stop_codon:yes gene_type:complete
MRALIAILLLIQENTVSSTLDEIMETLDSIPAWFGFILLIPVIWFLWFLINAIRKLWLKL